MENKKNTEFKKAMSKLTSHRKRMSELGDEEREQLLERALELSSSKAPLKVAKVV